MPCASGRKSSCYCETLDKTPLFQKVENHIRAYAKTYDEEYNTPFHKAEAEWKRAAEKDIVFMKAKHMHKFKIRTGQGCRGCEYCKGVTL
jgi:hypothetical protein